ncbi:L,D-transpeptidase family protein [Serpentinicella alkaliphila]|uniref:LysM domain-containing protein n=1 Tax=Serpentinicella alkaliphila TaxID=1734049 RepID=A0A4R2SWI2_9FIRM|nr:L,D-transpeptidase family protein [Serpentinicella alkaliphila]QUH24771.1 L,D-transpeptidase family protein [Serpentinicella alkaliphila]TCP94837.1 LysM domain-containing protein [Serpentinicella alkaliphila]
MSSVTENELTRFRKYRNLKKKMRNKLCILLLITALSLLSFIFIFTKDTTLVCITSASTNSYPQTENFTPNLEEESLVNTHSEQAENIKEYSNSNAVNTTAFNNSVPVVTTKIESKVEQIEEKLIDEERIGISTIDVLNKQIIVYHQLTPGDTIFSLSKKHYNSAKFVNKLEVDNNIKNSSVDLKAGSTLNILNPKILDVYTVKTGDTIFSITKHYFSRALYTNFIQSTNGINNPNTDIKAGMKLKLPLINNTLEYIVQPGETLYSIISKHFELSSFQEYIVKHNNITAPDLLKSGTVLEIPNPFFVEDTIIKKRPIKINTITANTLNQQKESYIVEISISNNSLSILSDNKIVRTFKVATGKNNSTPTGTFKIVNKIQNPWYSPKGIPGGSPENPLGTRWLGLDVADSNGTIYGIHGTNEPYSIGKYVSQGCIRMHNKDVEWLFTNLPIGTVVAIKK